MVPGILNVHFVWYSALNHNSTRRPSREGRKNEHCGARGKKRELFGGPAGGGAGAVEVEVWGMGRGCGSGGVWGMERG